MEEGKMMMGTPVVYAVGNTYQILFYLTHDAYASVKIGETVFDDAVCGNMRSLPGMRRICVPQALLNSAGAYTLRLERIEARLCYRTKTIAVEETTYPFVPVKQNGEARAYMIGDAHGNIDGAIKAAKQSGAFDFLIVNGDIGESADEAQMLQSHELASRLTGGSKPVVYARGNHENRGAAAEILPQYIPLRDGCTYYTFRLGGIWGIVLDCGEDKTDDHPEYGGAARFYDFRLRQTAYLRQVIAAADTEFGAADVTHRICVVHTQFPRTQEPLFDTERELYQIWCDLLDEMGVELILSAHMHCYQYLLPGDPDLRLQTHCPLLIGTWNHADVIGGSSVVFEEENIRIVCKTNDGITRFEGKLYD